MPDLHMADAISEAAERSILAQTPVVPGLPAFAGKFIPIQQARALYRRVSSREGFRLEALLAEMKIEVEVQTSDLERIPAKGPLVAVANHPFGVLDGACLSVLLSRVRSDVRVLTNSLLAGIPELHQHCIFVDPFQTQSSADKNLKPLKQALDWLRQGGALAVFPAGEVSQINVREAQVTDPEWNTVAARLVRKTGASALPVYFSGRNSVAFHLLGLIHPRLRTLFFLQEFLQQREKEVRVRIGNAIPSELSATWKATRKRPNISACALICCPIAARSPISLPAEDAVRTAPQAAGGDRCGGSIARSLSTILRRCPPAACSWRMRTSRCTLRARRKCRTRSTN